jgi:hypothetical protein
MAQATVLTQRRASDIHRRMQMGAEDYDTVPNESPADVEAATTRDQNETWVTHGHARTLERQILEALYRRLHPDEE